MPNWGPQLDMWVPCEVSVNSAVAMGVVVLLGRVYVGLEVSLVSLQG